jgi:hypothetical protein
METLGSPKCKIFALLVLQNYVWTADRLQKRGRPNCENFELFNQVQESAAHLLFHCRFTRPIWESLKSWLGLLDIQPQDWTALHSIKKWWRDVIKKISQHGKAIASLAMLLSWEIWKERIARVFRNILSTANMLVMKIKEEVSLWSLANANHFVI